MTDSDLDRIYGRDRPRYKQPSRGRFAFYILGTLLAGLATG